MNRRTTVTDVLQARLGHDRHEYTSTTGELIQRITAMEKEWRASLSR